MSLNISLCHSRLLNAIETVTIRKLGYEKREFLHPLHSAPPLGARRNRKTRMAWLPEGRRLRICLVVSTEYRRVRDRQTNRQIFCNSTAQRENNDTLIRSVYDLCNGVHLQLPLMIPNPDFRGTRIFDAKYLRNDMR